MYTIFVHSDPYGFVMVCPKKRGKPESNQAIRGTTQIFHGRAVTCATIVHVCGDPKIFPA